MFCPLLGIQWSHTKKFATWRRGNRWFWTRKRAGKAPGKRKISLLRSFSDFWLCPEPLKIIFPSHQTLLAFIASTAQCPVPCNAIKVSCSAFDIWIVLRKENHYKMNMERLHSSGSDPAHEARRRRGHHKSHKGLFSCSHCCNVSKLLFTLFSGTISEDQSACKAGLYCKLLGN